MTQKLEALWKRAAIELAIDVVAPFSLKVANDTIILDACFFVKNFGAKNGMLIFNDYSEIKPYINDIKLKDYGFSIIDEPTKEGEFFIEDYMDVLSDWGWTGDDSERPIWFRDSPEQLESE